MSIRCFFILSIQKKSLLYTRSFPVIEAKAKRIGLEPLPPLSREEDESELVHGVLLSLGIELEAAAASTTDNSHMTASAKLDLSSSTLPGLRVPFKSVSLWPILVTEQAGLLYCALPLMYSDDPELVHHLPVTSAFSFLQHLMSFTNNESKLMQLDSYLSVIIPLGRFIGGRVPVAIEKKPSSGEDVIVVNVNEKVSCKSSGEETVFGSVVIDSDALNRSPRSNLTLSLQLSDLDVVLPPVASLFAPDKIQVDLGRSGNKVSIHYQRKLSSTDPTGNIIRHEITAKKSPQPGLCKVSITLMLNKFPENLKFKVTQFSFIWKTNPSDMSRILNAECTAGKVSLEAMGLVWNLGPKMSRTSRVVLTADVMAPNGLSEIAAAVSFRIENISQAFVITRDSMTVNETKRPCKLLLEKSISSADYRIHFHAGESIVKPAASE
jgi:hypothetical protein